MPIHEQEEAFVRHFIVADKQERYLQFLSKPKTRGKFLRDLYHRLAFKGALVTELPPAKRTVVEVEQRLQTLGAETMVYVMAPYARLDQQWLPLTDVLTDILSTGSEAILCCLKGQLAFVQTEDSVYILNDQPQKQAS
jgi:hypothetical protein